MVQPGLRQGVLWVCLALCLALTSACDEGSKAASDAPRPGASAPSVSSERPAPVKKTPEPSSAEKGAAPPAATPDKDAAQAGRPGAPAANAAKTPTAAGEAAGEGVKASAVDVVEGGADAPKAQEKGGSAQGAVEAKPFVFKKASMKAGAKVIERAASTMRMEMVVTMGKDTRAVKSIEERVEKRTVTVKSVNAEGIITELEVHYDEQSLEKIENDIKVKPEAAPVKGKTYRLEFKDALLVVLNADGSPVSSTEARIVQADYGTLGRPDELVSLLPDGPLRVGETIDLPENIVRSLVEANDQPAELEDFSLVYKGVGEVAGRPVALFKLKLRLSLRPGPGMVLTMDMGGEVVLSEQGWLQRFEMRGPVEVSLDGQLQGQVKAEGGGEVRFNKSLAY